jgi:signal transduction histidine kinase
VSLALSGAITWYLVSRLVTDNAQQQLDQNVVQYASKARQAECLERLNPLNSASRCLIAVRDQSLYVTQFDANLDQPLLQGDRLLLLDTQQPPQVIAEFDSEGTLPPMDTVHLPARIHRLVNLPVADGSATLGGQPYLFAAVKVTQGKFVRWVVLARPEDLVTAPTRGRLVFFLLTAGGAAMVLAALVSILLARAVTKPLRVLEGAAEDIAAGNYASRAAVSGPGEVGVVARAFNRMADAVERTRRQQRDFLADVSHELKTPLTSLIGFSQAMVDGSLRTDQERQRAAVIVNEESHRLLRMAQELLDLARVEAGQITFHPQPVDMAVQVWQEAEIVRSRAESRGLSLRVALPPDLPPVRADPERLHQVLGNLVDNAVKYAPEHSEVEITAETHAEWVITEVRNAVGLDAPDPSRMFDRFYRGDRSRASSGGGVGLGLAISQRLTVAQGGQLVAYLRAERLHLRLAMPAMPSGRAAPALIPGTPELHPRLR